MLYYIPSIKLSVLTRGGHGLDFGFFGSGSCCLQRDQEWDFLCCSRSVLNFVFSEKKKKNKPAGCFLDLHWFPVKQEWHCLCIVGTGSGANSKFSKRNWIRTQKYQSPHTASSHLTRRYRRVKTFAEGACSKALREHAVRHKTLNTLSWFNVVFAYRDHGSLLHTFTFSVFQIWTDLCFSNRIPIQTLYFTIQSKSEKQMLFKSKIVSLLSGYPYV